MNVLCVVLDWRVDFEKNKSLLDHFVEIIILFFWVANLIIKLICKL